MNYLACVFAIALLAGCGDDSPVGGATQAVVVPGAL